MKGEQIFDAWAHNAYLNNGAFWTSQSANDVFLRHLHTRNGRVVNAHDAVASHDAHLLRGSIDNGLYNEQCVFGNVKLHANAFERAL